MQDGTKVYIDKEIDIFGVGLKKFFGPIDTGIVDQNVKLHGIDKRAHGGAIGDVDGVRYTASALCQIVESSGASGNRVNFDIFPAKSFNDCGADT